MREHPIAGVLEGAKAFSQLVRVEQTAAAESQLFDPHGGVNERRKQRLWTGNVEQSHSPLVGVPRWIWIEHASAAERCLLPQDEAIAPGRDQVAARARSCA